MPSNDSTSPPPRAPALNEKVRSPDFRVQRYECLGLWVNLIEPPTIIDLYGAAIRARRRLLVGSVNLHTAYCHKTDPTVRRFFETADLVYVDGMPIIWWLKCLAVKAAARHRATFADWLPALLARARDEGWRVYYLGNRPGVTATVAAQFRKRLPGLDIRAAHGHFDQRPSSSENVAVVEDINAFDPDILLVGMGIPTQEQWVLANGDHLSARVIHRCGATADFFADVDPLAPRWLGRLGLEGVFRLVTRPRRLWRRYLAEPWFLLDLAAKDVCRVLRARARASA
jgi:N-acetylglucosaminyldiphosphoundecaprenol N-acetyl-beta-D-mannosaminyltransferase